jgi:class 3 adenylate cyclase/CHASE2 domain-containing sensor protein
MKPPSARFIPAFLCGAVIVLVGLFHFLSRRSEAFQFLHHLECITYDWRVREAAKHPLSIATNLGFAFIDDPTIEEVRSGRLGYKADLYWPRHVYGRLIQELKTQGAEAIALDILFPQLRPQEEVTVLPGGSQEKSDYFFARQLAEAGNVILGADKGVLPHSLFRTSAWAIGDIAALRESGGILRQTRAFEDYLEWHPLIKQSQLRIDGFEFDTNKLVFPQVNSGPVTLSIDTNGYFSQTTLYKLLMAELGGPTNLPPKANPMDRAYTRYRVWDLGITLAAHHLKLDLANAVIEPGRRIVLRGTNGIERVIPIDSKGQFYIDWSIAPTNRALTRESVQGLLAMQTARARGQTNDLREIWGSKLVIVGSTASGNDLTDYGATPLEANTILTSRNWNVANSVLTGRFIQPSPLSLGVALIALLSALSGLTTRKLQTLPAAAGVIILTGAYVFICRYLYVQSRFWLPIVMPCAGLILTHFLLVTYRAVFEQREQRRIRSIFAKLVSPNVVHELLQAKTLSLRGARREVTIFFSDVRGFTEMTDESHARAEAYVLERNLTTEQAEAYFNEEAQEVLQTVNQYLSLIADNVKKHEGTLDKYIGDCVMAFWGAPTPNEKHAVSCVRAAMDAQRAMAALNEERADENTRREQQNVERVAEGKAPLPPLKLLSMGSGINSGVVTIGLMGSEQHILNYTVFGREVNLAARLEGVSGRGRIVISESTWKALQKYDPELGATCQELPPAAVKGFRSAVNIYEVPWKQPGKFMTSHQPEGVLAPGPTPLAAKP